MADGAGGGGAGKDQVFNRFQRKPEEIQYTTKESNDNLRESGGPSGLAVVRPLPRPSLVGLRARASALDPGIR